jgi:hypothetical protein
MVDIFKQMNEQIKENKVRWKKIDGLAGTLEAELDRRDCNENSISLIASLVLLLVEQLRPLNSAENEVEKLQNEIGNLINGLAGGKK